VRAVGTAFNVRLAPAVVDVLVTEGTVQVASKPDASPPSTGGMAKDDTAFHSLQPVASSLVAGHGIHIALGNGAPLPRIDVVSQAEMQHRLEWRLRLRTWESAPLASVVADFNRYGSHHHEPRLVITDAALQTLRIGGSFRVDQADAFVRLLTESFGVQAQRQDNVIYLHQGPERTAASP